MIFLLLSFFCKFQDLSTFPSYLFIYLFIIFHQSLIQSLRLINLSTLCFHRGENKKKEKQKYNLSHV